MYFDTRYIHVGDADLVIVESAHIATCIMCA